jgi:ectoine hydroxylase-related dioxygenase (phytanoyl-CoA dioxygenase family)
MQPTPTILPGLDRPFPLTAEQIAAYRRDGCIRLREVLDTATLKAIRPALRRLVDAATRDLPPLAERGTYGKAFQQVMNLWRQDEEVKAFVFSRRLARIAAELMEVDGVRLYHDQALYKEPGGGPTPWHADQHYWPLEGDRTITVWIPLQQTPMEMGPLAFLPGSQTIDLGRDLAISDESEREIGRRVNLSRLPMNEAAYELGDVSFHSGWTFHRAGGNQSREPREVMTMIYFADGTRLAKPRSQAQISDHASWMPGAQIGQPVATALNPLVWTRS